MEWIRGDVSDPAAMSALTKKADIVRGIKLGFEKFEALDAIERELFYLRPREIIFGQAETIYKKGIKLIEQAQSVKEIKKASKETFEKYKTIKIDSNKYIPKVYLTGEFFVLLDPFANMEIEKELGRLGVEVQRQIMLSLLQSCGRITAQEAREAGVKNPTTAIKELIKDGHNITKIEGAINRTGAQKKDRKMIYIYNGPEN